MTPNAQAFLRANEESPVIAGAAIEPDPRKPARGARYHLKDGRKFTLSVDECRSLPMPRWDI